MSFGNFTGDAFLHVADDDGGDVVHEERPPQLLIAAILKFFVCHGSLHTCILKPRSIFVINNDMANKLPCRQPTASSLSLAVELGPGSDVHVNSQVRSPAVLLFGEPIRATREAPDVSPDMDLLFLSMLSSTTTSSLLVPPKWMHRKGKGNGGEGKLDANE